MAAKGSRHAMALLHRFDVESPAFDFLNSLLSGAESYLPSLRGKIPLADLALYGISEEVWMEVVRAARLQFKLEQLSGNFPVVNVTDERVESDGVRLQMWGGQPFRPDVMEDWLGVPMLKQDMQTFLDALRMLTEDTSLVVEVARGV